MSVGRRPGAVHSEPAIAGGSKQLPTNPARRDFLRASAALGGGLLIGIALDACSDRPAGQAVAPASSPPPPSSPPVRQNAWLAIGADNTIRFYSGQSEMGQGVYTALPTLLAEELEVPVARITVVAGEAGEQFINDLLGTQVTGGSTSVRDAWVKLRRAGAEARLRLMRAAADRWNLPVDQLRVADGAVLNPNGDSLTYGELADAAAAIAAPETIPLKPGSAFTQIGRQQARLDSAAKIAGTAEYGIDVRRPGQVYAAISLCPVLGGRLAAVDATAARRDHDLIDVVELDNAVVVVAATWWQASQARAALEITWDSSAGERPQQ